MTKLAEINVMLIHAIDVIPPTLMYVLIVIEQIYG